MIRASNSADAPHVSLLVNKGDGVSMIYRETSGGETSSKCVGVWQEDVELRLVKTGNSVECSYKHPSATDWFVIGTATAELGDAASTFQVGSAVASNDWSPVQLYAGPVNVTAA